GLGTALRPDQRRAPLQRDDPEGDPDREAGRLREEGPAHRRDRRHSVRHPRRNQRAPYRVGQRLMDLGSSSGALGVTPTPNFPAFSIFYLILRRPPIPTRSPYATPV